MWFQQATQYCTQVPSLLSVPAISGTMFTGATKIVKPEGQEADEFEQTVAQELFNLEVRWYTNWLHYCGSGHATQSLFSVVGSEGLFRPTQTPPTG